MNTMLSSVLLILLGFFVCLNSQSFLEKIRFQVLNNSTGQLSLSSNDIVFYDQKSSTDKNRTLVKFDYKTKERSFIEQAYYVTAWNDIKGGQKVRYVLLAEQIPDWTFRTLRFVLYDRVDMKYITYAYTTLENNTLVQMANHFEKDSNNKTDENLIKIGTVTQQGSFCTWTFNIQDKRITDKDCTHAHKFNATSIVSSSDGQSWITAGGDSAIRLWKNGKAKFSWVQSKPITTLAISKNHILLSGDKSGTIKAYNQTTKAPYSIPSFLYHKTSVLSLTTSSDNKYLVSCATDGQMILWDLVKGTMLQKNSFEKGKIAKKVQFYTTNYKPSSYQRLNQNPQAQNLKVQVDPKEFLYSSHQDGTVIVWEVTASSQGQKFDLRKSNLQQE